METADNLVPSIPQETSDKAIGKAHGPQLGAARHSTVSLLLCTLRGGYVWSSSVDCTGVCTVSLSWRLLSRRDLQSVCEELLVSCRPAICRVGRKAGVRDRVKEARWSEYAGYSKTKCPQ